MLPRSLKIMPKSPPAAFNYFLLLPNVILLLSSLSYFPSSVIHPIMSTVAEKYHHDTGSRKRVTNRSEALPGGRAGEGEELCSLAP